MRRDWERVKVRIMLDVNRAKYEQNPQLQQELLATGDIEIRGGPSTSWSFQGVSHNWSHWNGLIQMLLREEFKPERDTGALAHIRAKFDEYLGNEPGGSFQDELVRLKQHGLVMPWTCHPCTFENESYPSCCEMCGALNPAYTAALEQKKATGSSSSSLLSAGTLNPGPLTPLAEDGRQGAEEACSVEQTVGPRSTAESHSE